MSSRGPAATWRSGWIRHATFAHLGITARIRNRTRLAPGRRAWACRGSGNRVSFCDDRRALEVKSDAGRPIEFTIAEAIIDIMRAIEEPTVLDERHDERARLDVEFTSRFESGCPCITYAATVDATKICADK